MSFIDLITQRQSVRKYASAKVEQEKIDIILHAARLAPSASNSQPWHFIVVSDPILKDKVAKATFSKLIPFNKFAVQAPLLMVIVKTKSKIITQIGGRIKSREFPLYDIGIVAEHICLQAAELGLGSCMLGWFNEKKIRKTLRVPVNFDIALVITLGYAAEGYKLRDKRRKTIKEMTSYNVFNHKSI
ncbi:MAG: NAD(P)H nitroreductase [Bacteroidetes bacterium]|jgi:nitroreductase|nr:NAD(P)H nitroreductase [Bacteroidota bacterium]MBT5529874.1 NAD(P)H nitroreductase [Cytophagia bacterium]MBT3801055.1 NAD(P)H nitroreductase [Bacteroidota bacterium]MBT3933132.1 NAD(P)H nitroreductase [Bacteroidota bacterium]MBT4338341.1 NAD(P)H nitroreductase [Bacteroidota bacterium]